MVELRPCTDADIPELARMNGLLDEAVEGANKHSQRELERTLDDAVNRQNHRAFFFVGGDEVMGYALCDMRQNPIYIRQFFISDECRGQGVGQAAFRALARYLDTDEISLDVHCGNRAAIAFWKKLGFTEKHVRMLWAPQETG